MIAIVVIGVVDVGEMARNGLMMILGRIVVLERMGIHTAFLKLNLSLDEIMDAYNYSRGV